MRSVTLLSILSLVLVACPGGSASKPDAYLCTFIMRDPVENSASFCINAKTGEEKEVPVQEMHKWITSDPTSYDVFREWYKSQCKAK